MFFLIITFLNVKNKVDLFSSLSIHSVATGRKLATCKDAPLNPTQGRAFGCHCGAPPSLQPLFPLTFIPTPHPALYSVLGHQGCPETPGNVGGSCTLGRVHFFTNSAETSGSLNVDIGKRPSGRDPGRGAPRRRSRTWLRVSRPRSHAVPSSRQLPFGPAAPPGGYGSPPSPRPGRPPSQSAGAAGRRTPRLAAGAGGFRGGAAGAARRGWAGPEAAGLAGPEPRPFRFAGLTFRPLGRAPSRH